MKPLIEEFAGWLARPRMLKPSGLRAPGALQTTLLLLTLYLAVLILVLSPLLGLWQKLMGLPGPEAFKDLSKAMLVPTVVLLAPILEELGFRAWLTGRVRALWLLACGLIAAGLLAMVNFDVAKETASLAFLGMVLVAPGGWWWLRKRGVVSGFERAFPSIVWCSIVLFSLSHLSNYTHLSWVQLPILLPLVLPQLWAGMVFSYARMRIGIFGSMMIHALGNSVALGLTFLGA